MDQVENDKFLIIDYSPYSFVYSDRENDESDFFGFRTYDTFDQIAIPFHDSMKVLIKDRNKTHFNINEVANIRLSGPMAFLVLGWQAMIETFKPELRKILDVSRLKARISFNGARSFLSGEFLTKIKQEHLTGYNNTHLGKVEMTFVTKLDPFLLQTIAGEELEGPGAAAEFEDFIGSEDEEGIGE